MRLLLLILLFPCALAAQPEMELLRSGAPIADGGTDSLDNTGSSPFNITWTIRNDGTTDLDLNGTPEIVVSAETNCSVNVLTPPTTPVAPAGGTTTFTLQVSPVSATEFSFEVSIANNDADENPYTFTFDGDTRAPSSGGGGGGGSGGGDCSTSEGTGPFWLLLLCGVLVVLHNRSTPRDHGRPLD